MPRDLAPLFPAKFSAVFPARRCAGNPDGDWPKRYTSTVNLADVTLTVPDTVKPLGVPGLRETTRSTAVALYSTAAGPPTNQAALDDLTAAMAQDFYDRRSVSFDTAYNGIISPVPHGLLDLITWDYTAEDQTTRLQSRPWRAEPIEFQHQDPAIADCQGDDRAPGVLLCVPGGTGGEMMYSVFDIEAGRLVTRFSHTATLDCTCSTPVTCPLTVKVIACGNSNFPLDGVTVTVKDSTGTNTIGSGITGSDGVATISLPAAGTYKVSTDACTPASTQVNVTCPAGASVTLSSCINVSVTLYGCTGGPIAVAPLPAVHITDPVTGWSSPTQVPRPGAYQVIVDESCNYEAAGPVAITVPSCSLYTTPPIQLTPKTLTRTIRVNGCLGLPLANATVTLEGAWNGYSQTQTTGADGIATFTGVQPSGDGNGGCDYTATISKARFETLIKGATVFCDQELIGIEQLTPADGFVCCGCADPWPTTLYVTDANGTHAAVYDPGTGEWTCCYSGPVDTLHCGLVQGFICQDDLNGADITVQGTAAIGYRISCLAGDPDTNGSMQLRQSVTACQTHSADNHSAVMTGWCNGTTPAATRCDGSQTPASPVVSTIDIQQCTGVPPLVLAFNLAGGCYPCGTVGVAE